MLNGKTKANRHTENLDFALFITLSTQVEARGGQRLCHIKMKRGATSNFLRFLPFMVRGTDKFCRALAKSLRTSTAAHASLTLREWTIPSFSTLAGSAL